jgi:hypothetical protein
MQVTSSNREVIRNARRGDRIRKLGISEQTYYIGNPPAGLPTSPHECLEPTHSVTGDVGNRAVSAA